MKVFVSKTKYQICLKTGGPPSKPKYNLLIDSELVP